MPRTVLSVAFILLVSGCAGASTSMVDAEAQVSNNRGAPAAGHVVSDTDDDTQVENGLRIIPTHLDIYILSNQTEPFVSIPYEFRSSFRIRSTTVSEGNSTGFAPLQFSWEVAMRVVDDEACFHVTLLQQPQDVRCIRSLDESLDYPFQIDERDFLLRIRFDESAQPNPFFRRYFGESDVTDAGRSPRTRTGPNSGRTSTSVRRRFMAGRLAPTPPACH